MSLTTRSILNRNLRMQGFTLTCAERRDLAIALRFGTGLCFVLISIAALVHEPAALAALALIGAGAGWTARHPFDRVWNTVVARLLDVPLLPPTPTRRRHAFKVATAWLATSAALMAAGLQVAALVLLAALLVLCGVQTVTYLCVPSLVLAGVDRLRAVA